MVVIPKKAKTRIMKEGADVLLPAVINILQEEKQATQFDPKTVHYLKYDAKKGKKGKKPSHRTESHGKKPDSSSCNGKKCYRCGDPYLKEHMEHCKAKNSTCRACNRVGHYQKGQRRALRRHTFWWKLPLPHSISMKVA